MPVSFSVTKIEVSKSKNLIFYVFFFNTNISVTTQDIAMKFCMTILHIHSEGSVSEIFYLGPSFYFMRFRKLSCQNIQKVTRFLM